MRSQESVQYHYLQGGMEGGVREYARQIRAQIVYWSTHPARIEQSRGTVRTLAPFQILTLQYLRDQIQILPESVLSYFFKLRGLLTVREYFKFCGRQLLSHIFWCELYLMIFPIFYRFLRPNPAFLHVLLFHLFRARFQNPNERLQRGFYALTAPLSAVDLQTPMISDQIIDCFDTFNIFRLKL